MNGIDWTRAEIGQELEPLVKPAIDKVQLVKYAGASGDFNLIHTDVETAKQVGLPGTIAHGMLSMGFLGQLCSQLVGTNGFVKHLMVRFAGMVFLEDVLTCRAKVTNKNEEERTLDLEILVEREPGKTLTTGKATLKFY
ncbi:dehydratase [Bacillus sp. FJAT-29790]|uniref:MaoC/PaaZ C-terminal domain-containing protein n=1 Tax=Bacillus sp. FJAT-29790 TaxID=1895002 RepID=UPI001C2154ED|nr:MaoC/PaaZ C-terminal domain-containing protein [Bacillus sp. FJAT-29790]MBU8878008.1 dehydratase [Bacillus sp. FJAT-29790]